MRRKSTFHMVYPESRFGALPRSPGLHSVCNRAKCALKKKNRHWLFHSLTPDRVSERHLCRSRELLFEMTD